MKADLSAEDWYRECSSWRDEVAALRAIALGMELVETMKWMHPCYTDRDKNILIIGWRKDGAVASFLNGALIDEPQGRFLQAGSDRSGRYLLFGSVDQIRADRPYLETLLTRAVAAMRAGLRVERLPDEIEYVEELQHRLDTDEAFRVAFEALTVGRRRGYNLHFAQAKQSASREARITRCTERIFLGKGLLDCVCGHSARLPGCDGSHKKFQ